MGKSNIRLTKISDNKFNGEHPNNINEGYIKEGDCILPPEVGLPFYVINGTKLFKSSSVTEIVDEFTFKTKNSTYKIEILETYEV